MKARACANDACMFIIPIGTETLYFLLVTRTRHMRVLFITEHGAMVMHSSRQLRVKRQSRYSLKAQVGQSSVTLTAQCLPIHGICGRHVEGQNISENRTLQRQRVTDA